MDEVIAARIQFSRACERTVLVDVSEGVNGVVCRTNAIERGATDISR
jgi:hypothetical protein